MKQILIPLILFSTSLNAQYIGVGISNKGACFYAGIVSEGIEVGIAHKVPLFSQETPTITSLQVGRAILLTNYDEDNYSITPSVGIAHYKVKDFKDFDNGGDIIEIAEVKPLFNLELSKDAYMGRMFLSATFCKTVYYSIGMKVFFNR